MKNWKTTIGGALSGLGSAIAGLSTLTVFTEPEYRKVGLTCLVVGCLLSAFGKFFGLLFAQDTNPAKDAKEAAAEQAIKQIPQQ